MMTNNEFQMQDKYDVYLCSSGYEDRTLGAIRTLKEHIKFEQAFIILLNPDDTRLLEKNQTNMHHIENNLTKHTSKTQIIDFRPDQVLEFTEFLQKNIDERQSILIDVTSFTRSFLYSILNMCMQILTMQNSALWVLHLPDKYHIFYHSGCRSPLIARVILVGLMQEFPHIHSFQ